MGWRSLFLALHIVSFTFIAGLLSNYNFVDASLYKDVKDAKSANILNLAVQMGRLDLASLAIAYLGVILAAAAIYGFWVYGHVVERTARTETKAIAPDVMAELLRNDPELWVRAIRDNPMTFRSALKDVMADTNGLVGDMDDAAANGIATSSPGDDR